MAFNEEEYVKQGEVFEAMSLQYANCEFVGNLFPRVDSGFDLYLMRDNSTFECLELDVITWLRDEAQGDELVFIGRFATPRNVRDLRQQVESRFAEWLQANLRLPPGGKFKPRWQKT